MTLITGIFVFVGGVLSLTGAYLVWGLGGMLLVAGLIVIAGYLFGDLPSGH